MLNKTKRAIKYYNDKEFNKAKELFEELLAIDSSNYELLICYGLTLFYLEEYNLALNYLKQADAIKKTPETQGALGLVYYKLNMLNDSQICLITSIVEKYNDEYVKQLEKLLAELKNDEALLGLKLLIIENKPKDIPALRDITQLASKLKKFDIALEYYKELLTLCPDDYVAWNNMGLVYEEINEWEKSYNCYKKALSLKDFFSPNFNLGIMSRKLHRFQDSINYLKKAVIQNPNSPQPKYSLSMSYMMVKDFKNGYPLYANHMTKIMPSFYKNEWDGKMHTDDTLCIFSTGGLGDMIMFARYFDYLKDYFKKIYILLPKTLHSIMKRNYPYLEIIDSSVIFNDFDWATTPMHILKHFDLDFTQIVPQKDGFLGSNPDKTWAFREKYFNHSKLKIAINWHGNREGTRTFFNRSMPIEKFEPIFELLSDKAVFYSIQKDESYTECHKYPNIVDMYSVINDFDDTASILKNCDLLISIDSSPIHMAGALGVNTYAILPYANEWRWFINDDKTIWYDSVELFRQDKEGDWDSAINKIYKKLTEN